MPLKFSKRRRYKLKKPTNDITSVVLGIQATAKRPEFSLFLKQFHPHNGCIPGSLRALTSNCYFEYLYYNFEVLKMLIEAQTVDEDTIKKYGDTIMQLLEKLISKELDSCSCVAALNPVLIVAPIWC